MHTVNETTNFSAYGDVAVDEIENNPDSCDIFGKILLKTRKKTQTRKYLSSKGEKTEKLFHVRYELLECGIRVIKSTTKQHVHDDVGHTRKGQLFHVKRTTLLLSQFVNHLFDFHQDLRLHHTLTESEPLQDRQTELTMSPKLGVVVST